MEMIAEGSRIQLQVPLEANKVAGALPAGTWGTVMHVFGPDGVIAWFGEAWNGWPQGRIVRTDQYQHGG